MGDFRVLHVLGLDFPSQRLLDRVSEDALDAPVPIFVPQWNRPAGPAVDGGNGAGQDDDVVEVNVGEANVGEANVGMAGDLQPQAAAPAVTPEGPARDGGSMVSAESSGVQGTKPDDAPAQPEDSAGAGVKQAEAKEGKNREKP